MTFANFAIESGVNAAKPAEPAPATEKPVTPAPAADTNTPISPISDAGEVSLGDDDDLDTVTVTDIGDTDDDGSSAPAVPEGVPDSPDEYVPPQIDGVPWNTEALSPVLAAAHKHGVSQAAVAEALQVYAAQVQEQQADLKRQDAQRLADVKQRLTPAERTAVDAASSVMSPDLRRAIRQARLPSGDLLLHNQEFLSLIAGIHTRTPGTPTTAVARAQNDAERERQIRETMKHDFEAYRRSSMPAELSAIMHRRGG